MTSLNTPQRLRMALEELGPTFIKLGQLLACRPDIVPEAFIEELVKLQDKVPPLPFSELKPSLLEQFPQELHTVFESIDERPLGSASIAQVHRAKLLTGEEVVLKIQKPGLQKTIREDTNVLLFIAELFDRYVPELKLFNPIGLAHEFTYAIEMETNFVVEANNLRRFYENFKGNSEVRIPKPFVNLTGPHVLVLEYMEGRPLTQLAQMPEVDRDRLMDAGLHAYFHMVFKDGLFHGDLHPGNILVLPDGQIGLIDFGMVGRLSRNAQSAIANMFVALATEDYERLAYEYIELSTSSLNVDRDAFARDLRLLLSPFFGLSLKSVNAGKMLVDSAGIAFRHQVHLPSELLLFFKSIVTIEGLGRVIKEDFDLLPYVSRFSADILKIKYDPTMMIGDIGAFTREISSLLRTLPGELKTYVRKLNHPTYAKPLDVVGLRDFQTSFIHVAYQFVYVTLIASFIIAGAMCAALPGLELYYGLTWVSWTLFGFAGFFGAITFYHWANR